MSHEVDRKRDLRVVAVDIGSVRTGSFAWAAVDAPEGGPLPEALAGYGSDPATAVEAVAEALGRDGRVVLALEAPMAVPVPGDWALLGKGRAGEGNRPWSASAGAGALGTGLVQGAWMLAELGRVVTGLSVTTQVRRWGDGTSDAARLLLVEAFVSGAGKPVATVLGQHAADAEAAARVVAERLAGGGRESDVVCAPHRVFNLLAAQARWAGLDIGEDELGLDVLVVRARPVVR
ncbi:hypothetical protein [Streptomyces sp. AS02]|uniref:hypothetical protein n=1 Tax=Streptomyces sp. AS02 TaxID=2938946 RepID=UPI0020218CAF|nr:hypothetical protein [Streptomyces sp. AS02]MCL8017448.1 hypothetical protein [Streptomyces sp. AS02]